MKNPFILPALAALIGFSVAWVVKPSAPSAGAPTTTTAEAAPRKSARTTALENRQSMADGKRPKEVKAGDFPLLEAAEKGPQTREEAKMLRLTEALGLTIGQQGEVIRLIEESNLTASGDLPIIEDLTLRGKAVEDGFRELLSPEQFTKFQELRDRDRENRIESRAQKELTRVIEEIDLSPDQRDEVLNRLRQSVRAELQAIPASATLLFEKSVLPTGKNELSVDGVLLLAKLGESIISDDPMAAHAEVLRNQNQEIEEKLRNYDGVLTSAQMGQYYAALAEQKAILSRMAMQKVREPVEAAPPAPIRAATPEEVEATGFDEADEVDDDEEE
ncbi:MAG: hypothetical protein WEB53_16320 [Akkermansiaceae bacterium]